MKFRFRHLKRENLEVLTLEILKKNGLKYAHNDQKQLMNKRVVLLKYLIRNDSTKSERIHLWLEIIFHEL